MKLKAYIVLLFVVLANTAFAKVEQACSKKMHSYYYLNQDELSGNPNVGPLFSPLADGTLDAPSATVANSIVAMSGTDLDNICVKNSYGNLKFAIDWDRTNVFESRAFMAKITVDIVYQTFNGSTFDNHTLTGVQLTIYYDPIQNTSTLQSESNYFIKGAHYVNFEVTDLKIYRADGECEIADYLPANITLESCIYTDYLYNNLNSIDADDFDHIGTCNSVLTDLGDRLLFSWCEQYNAEEYDLEWTFVPAGLTIDNDKYNFINNSTRIRVKQSNYEIPKIYNQDGTLVWRIRAVGRNCNNFSQLVYSDWSFGDNGDITDIATNWKAIIATGNSHEKDKNWQYAITFVEDGKYKEVIGYADGTLRGRQTVTRISTTDSVLVAQQYYDWQGRPAIQALPAPVYNSGVNYNDISSANPNTPELKYYPNFNGTFGLDDFDVNGDGCTISPQPMTAGADFYYSPDNTNKVGKNQYIPNANGYPYIQTEFTPDNTGRLRAQSGVGSDYKLGSGHETKFYYGIPLQVQLDRLFGSEVGFDSHYTKEMTIDGNGSVSVAYKDASGRVIATSLAGTPPASLMALESSGNAQPLTANLLTNHNTVNTGSNSIESTFTHIVSSLSEHTFTYSVNPQKYEFCELCYDCVYDLSLSITNECGENLVPEDKRTMRVGPDDIDGECENTSFSLNPFIVELPVGTYIITKKLTVNQQALDDNLLHYLENNTCIQTLEEFADDYESGVVNDCDDPCTDCFQPTACDVYKQFIIADITPGGQYASFYRNNDAAPYITQDGIPATTNPYSVFYTNNADPNFIPTSLPTGYMVPNYYTITTNITINGVTAPFNQWAPQKLFDNFQPEWADLLIGLHPEHCFYQFCLDDLTYKDTGEPADSTGAGYDLALMSVNDYTEANTKGYLDPLNLYSSSSFTFSSSHDITVNTSHIDPYFVQHATSRSYMNSLLNNYDGEGHNIWEVASMVQYGSYTPPVEGCLSDGYWTIFRGLYLSKKAIRVQADANENCPSMNFTSGTISSCHTSSNCSDNSVVDCGCQKRIVFGGNPSDIPLSGMPGINLDNFEDNIDDLTDYANNQIGSNIEQNCYSMRLSWRTRLMECPNLSEMMTDNLNIAADTAEFNDLLKLLAEICTNGSSSTDIFGANSCEPFNFTVRNFVDRAVNIYTTSSQSFSSFNQAINFYFERWGISPSEVCTPLVITMPMESNHNYFGMQPLDDCACETLLNQAGAFNSSSSTTGVCTLDDYIAQNPDYNLLQSGTSLLVDCFLRNYNNELPVNYLDLNCFDVARIAKHWLDANTAYGSTIDNTTEWNAFKTYLVSNSMAVSGDNAVDLKNRANSCLATVSADVLDNQSVPQIPATIGCENCLNCNEMNALWLKFSRLGIIPTANLQYPFPPDYDYLQLFTNYVNQMQGANYYSYEIFDFVNNCYESSQGGTATAASLALARKSNQIIDSTDFDTFIALDSLTALKVDSLYYSATDSLECPYDIKVQIVEDTLLFTGYQYKITIKPTGTCDTLRQNIVLDIYPMAKLSTGQFSRLDTTWSFLPVHLEDTARYSAGVKMRVAGEPTETSTSAVIFASKSMVVAPIRPCQPTGTNLISNGNFESSTVGVGTSSGLGFITNLSFASGSGTPAGTYQIGDISPQAKCTDHTPASGTKMLIVNGPTTNTKVIWGRNITVTPNTDYTFIYWAQSHNNIAPAQLLTKINGTQAGAVFTLSATTCQWTKYSLQWNSGTATTAQIRIYDNTTAATGNDFALDDIGLYGCGMAAPPRPPVSVNPFPNLELCNHGMVPPVTVEIPSCDDYYQTMNDFLTNQAYQTYVAGQIANFKNKYTQKCLSAVYTESYTMAYTDNEYHFTLYYYDQAGNLVKTIPPAGVNFIDLGASSGSVTQLNISPTPPTDIDDPDYFDIPTFPNTIQGQIDAYRFKVPTGYEDLNTHTGYFANHTLPTNYRFNTLNQPVWQDMPDAEYSQFWYDKLGRIIISQSGRQRNISTKLYSYTLYDNLGRIYEVGQLLSCVDATNGFPTGMLDENLIIDMDAYISWVNSSTRTEITRTFYDKPAYVIDGFTPQNLRGRVASITIAHNNVYDNINTCSGCSSVVNMPVFDEAYHYSYDIHGNVKVLYQETPGLAAYGQRFTRTDYEYDLVSGKVNLVAYQRGKIDQMYHRYEYDADNRITDVYTSTDSLIWKKQANYDYYTHGPLARTELGDLKVQGLDYAYTIQGWIKSVNGASLNETRDIGQDGNTASVVANPNEFVARDAFGFALFYNNGDYEGIGGSSLGFLPTVPSGSDVANHLDNYGLYNGNIAGMQVALESNDNNRLPTVFNQYRYDQLNRIISKDVVQSTTLHQTGNNTWASATADDRQKESFSYDANGNILSVSRFGDKTVGSTALQMDDFTYHYTPGTNQLAYVGDNTALSSNYTNDIDNQDIGNYTYDADGNLIADVAEEIDNIEWTAYGKIRRITRVATSTKPDLEFEYDPAGQRALKIAKPHGYLTQPNHWTYTYYRRDASGNIMANYEVTNNGIVMRMYVTAQNIYGSARLGVINKHDETSNLAGISTPPVPMPTIVAPPDRPTYYAFDETYTYSIASINDAFDASIGSSYGIITYTLGNISYELANHLGNVLTTISDRKLPKGDGASPIEAIAYFAPDVLTTQDYYAFGSLIPERSGEATCVPCSVLKDAITSTYNTTLDGTLTNSLYMAAITAAFTDKGLSLPAGIDDVGDILALCSIDDQVIPGCSSEDAEEITFVWLPDADPKRTLCPDGSLSFTNTARYKFGFNGQERDNEILGEGNAISYTFRISDARIGRFFSIDPLTADYPFLTPYQFASNQPIHGKELEGLENESTKGSTQQPISLEVPYIPEFKTNTGNPYADYPAAMSNQLVKCANCFIYSWNFGVKSAQSLSRGTWSQDWQDDTNNLINSVKQTWRAGQNWTPPQDLIGDIFDWAISPEAVANYTTGFLLGYNPRNYVLPEIGLTLNRPIKPSFQSPLIQPNGTFYSVAFETKLSVSLYPGLHRSTHFRYANYALEKAMNTDAVFSESMSKLGINIPRSNTGTILGKSPSNWVWHHSIDDGIMQLVPKAQHTQGSVFWPTLHPNGLGGYALWGKKFK